VKFQLLVFLATSVLADVGPHQAAIGPKELAQRTAKLRTQEKQLQAQQFRRTSQQVSKTFASACALHVAKWKWLEVCRTSEP
jgi:hypothetical protein